MAKKPKKTAENRAVVDAAVGVVAWLLAVEIMVLLEHRGVLKSKDSKRIMSGALNALELLEASTAPHPAFEIAHSILAGQLEGWDQGLFKDRDG